MNELLKRLGIGAIIGLVVALLLGIGTQKIQFLKDLLDESHFFAFMMTSKCEN